MTQDEIWNNRWEALVNDVIAKLGVNEADAYRILCRSSRVM